MSKNQNADRQDVPLGLGFALAQNLTAMERFSNLSREQQGAVIEASGKVGSKAEMRKLVSDLAEGHMPGGLGHLSNISGAASFNEYTGLMPTPPQNEEQLENYKLLFKTEFPEIDVWSDDRKNTPG